MSQYQSFFISAGGTGSQCDDLNHFMRSHVVIRTVENIISAGNNCGIQILVEYKDIGISNQQDKKNAKIDWRAGLATDGQRAIFDKCKKVTFFYFLPLYISKEFVSKIDVMSIFERLSCLTLHAPSMA
ncbi:MAG: hypothetical protein SPJ89_08525 [Treponema sp.]|nr:hypothetical protein [Spirochaetia bacterium]MDD7460684.1 hypothetical protein [Spirochaetales bacterium]MDY5812008.1 hypothetical protein [Treponema sp.]